MCSLNVADRTVVDWCACSVLAQAKEAGVDVLAVQIPFKLEDGALPELPTANVRVTLSTAYTSPSESAVQALQAAVKAGHVVDIHIESGDGGALDDLWEGLEDLLTKATEAATIGEGAIVLGMHLAFVLRRFSCSYRVQRIFCRLRMILSCPS